MPLLIPVCFYPNTTNFVHLHYLGFESALTKELSCSLLDPMQNYQTLAVEDDSGSLYVLPHFSVHLMSNHVTAIKIVQLQYWGPEPL